jgi:hypothetical protein
MLKLLHKPARNGTKRQRFSDDLQAMIDSHNGKAETRYYALKAATQQAALELCEHYYGDLANCEELSGYAIWVREVNTGGFEFVFTFQRAMSDYGEPEFHNETMYITNWASMAIGQGLVIYETIDHDGNYIVFLRTAQ